MKSGKRIFLLMIAVTLAVVGITTAARADCAMPAGAVCNGVACGGEARPAGYAFYNADHSVVEVCAGTVWRAVVGGVGGSGCTDSTPDTFNFTDLANQATSTLVTSDIIQITGLGCTVGTQISGEGSPQYRICADAACSSVEWDWTSAALGISTGKYVQLRLTTSAAGGDTYSATFSVGNEADVWNATPTGDCTGSPAPGTVCADGTVYAGLSPDGNTPMFVTRCDAGQSWDGSNCTGSRFSLSWNNGTSNYLTTGYTSAVTGEANTTGLAGLSDAGAPYSAAQDCDSLSQDGHTDWYLPAKSELDVIYGNKDVIGNFVSAGYWSSSEYATNTAWRQSFSDGSQYNNTKDPAYFVRCARR